MDWKKVLSRIKVINFTIIFIIYVTYFLGIFEDALELASLLFMVNLAILCVEKWNTKRKDSIIGIIGLIIIIILDLILRLIN